MIPIGMKIFILMMFVLSSVILAIRANAQTMGPGLPDLSAMATTNALNAAVAPLATNTALTAMGATIPAACTTAPFMDSLNGVVGTSTPCSPHPDNSGPTAVQAANAALDAACNWAVTFARSTTSSSPVVHANVVQASPTMPIPCIVSSRSTTAAAGKCFPAQTTTLNLSIITAGLNLAPFGSTCTAGMPVMIVVRDPSQ